jgi:hypothetical protein
MDEFKCEKINFVLGWLQENGFERLKRVSEEKNVKIQIPWGYGGGGCQGFDLIRA